MHTPEIVCVKSVHTQSYVHVHACTHKYSLATVHVHIQCHVFVPIVAAHVQKCYMHVHVYHMFTQHIHTYISLWLEEGHS